jgi:hypothetical protein
MFMRQSIIKTEYTRRSKTGTEHTYYRTKTIVHLRCDNCDCEFTRERGSVDPKRLSNNYFHVCPDCDSKKFAQRKGVERKKVWTLNASSNLPIGKL